MDGLFGALRLQKQQLGNHSVGQNIRDLKNESLNIVNNRLVWAEVQTFLVNDCLRRRKENLNLAELSLLNDLTSSEY